MERLKRKTMITQPCLTKTITRNEKLLQKGKVDPEASLRNVTALVPRVLPQNEEGHEAVLTTENNPGIRTKSKKDPRLRK